MFSTKYKAYQAPALVYIKSGLLQ